MTKKNNRYYKIIEFIKNLKIDREMSKYLYMSTGNQKFYNEYKYNKNMLKTIREQLNKYKELKLALAYMYLNKNIYNANLEIPIRTLYGRINKQEKKFTQSIYEIEDKLYDKYIKGIKNGNNTETKSKRLA